MIAMPVAPKAFAVSALALYVLAIGMSKSNTGVSVLALVGAAGCLLLSMSPEDRTNKYRRREMALMLAAFFIPGIGVVAFGYQDGADQRHFRAYLDAHQCRYVGDEVTGMAGGRCDNHGNCDEAHEVSESFYACGATGNRISLKQFSAGNYGSAD